MILRIDERNPTRLAGLRVHQHLMRDRIGAQREVAGVHRGVDQPGRRIERGVDVAATGTPATRAAPEALAAVLVFHTVRRDAGAIRRQRPPHLLETLAQLHLGGGQLVGALEQAVGEMRQVLLVAGDAEVQVHLVVVRLEIGVGDRPVFPIAVVRFALEVVVGEAEREAAPDVRLATQESRAHPGVARTRVRVVFLVHQNVLDVVRSTPAAHVREHVLERRTFCVGGLPHRVFVVADGVIAGRRFSAARMVIGPHPLRCEDMGSHAARRAGAYDDGIVGAA